MAEYSWCFIMAALAKQLHMGLSASHIEAQAAVTAMKFTREAGSLDLICEGDALSIIQAIDNFNMDYSFFQ